ncbi:GGDEF domain-containing protein [Magnetospirillum sp. SS-4]|uniref:GGDEF domain-containing protein n=1 Tax=Magnetospirillum sp. SS-4 TaxID=2681465 RepID=UPI001385694F|nr:GGDEF domain-containing protein [Magnetospirillum sp. SS-4]CAA7625912.1 Diguanylate cyclase domain protein [Magnetospirillum sp. SS-4]
MTDPITMDEDSDVLHAFNARFREAIAQHAIGRLDLFFRLQFPDAGDLAADKTDIVHRLDMLLALEKDAPADIMQHPLADNLRARLAKLIEQASAALEASESGGLEPTHFLRLTSSMRKLDVVVNRLMAGISASMTDVDELTGLLNRAALDRDIEREHAQSKRTEVPLSIAMVDADHFKNVNDDFGHAFGDFVLEEISDRFKGSLRPRDRVYRYGGEEFLVILPETPLDKAMTVLERLRKAVCATPVKEGDNEILQTVSAGVAELGMEEQPEAAIERADQALYQAKEAGRNRVMASDVLAETE